MGGGRVLVIVGEERVAAVVGGVGAEEEAVVAVVWRLEVVEVWRGVSGDGGGGASVRVLTSDGSTKSAMRRRPPFAGH